MQYLRPLAFLNLNPAVPPCIPQKTRKFFKNYYRTFSARSIVCLLNFFIFTDKFALWMWSCNVTIW